MVSLAILGRLRELGPRLGLPMLIGASRKGFIGQVLGQPVDGRLNGSLATVAMAVAAGMDAVRVHDVAPAVEVARMSEAIAYGWSEPMPNWTPIYLGLGREPRRPRRHDRPRDPGSSTPSARFGCSGEPRSTRRPRLACSISRCS